MGRQAPAAAQLGRCGAAASETLCNLCQGEMDVEGAALLRCATYGGVLFALYRPGTCAARLRLGARSDGESSDSGRSGSLSAGEPQSSDTCVAGTGVAGTGVAGTGVAGTGVAGTGVAAVRRRDFAAPMLVDEDKGPVLYYSFRITVWTDEIISPERV